MATEVKLFGKWTYDDVKTKEEISLSVRLYFLSFPIRTPIVEEAKAR